MVKSQRKGSAVPSSNTPESVPVVNSLGRIIVTFVIAAVAIYYRLQPIWRDDPNAMVLASWNSTIGTSGIRQQQPCLPDHNIQFSGCEPAWCGRYLADTLVNGDEVAQLIRIAEKGMALGGGAGGATILDLHSGALTVGTKFASVRVLAEKNDVKELFTAEDLELYRSVRKRIQVEIERVWKVKSGLLKLTKPTFFSRMTDKPPATIHDEYWHVHTDTEQYDAFHYTALLYLNTYNKHFKGGRFMFDTPQYNHTVHPKAGRVSVFTSGRENPHHVERVEEGVRYAITIPFTCNPDFGISDPVF